MKPEFVEERKNFLQQYLKDLVSSRPLLRSFLVLLPFFVVSIQLTVLFTGCRSKRGWEPRVQSVH